MKVIEENLLDFPEDITTIFHVANIRKTFGAGIAKQIKDRYPAAYQADLDYPWDDVDRFGEFSAAKVRDGKYVVNLYAQDLGGDNLSEDGKPFRLEHYKHALESYLYEIDLRSSLSKLGFPWMIGSGLSQGPWDKIKELTEYLVSQYDVEAVWVKYEG